MKAKGICLLFICTLMAFVSMGHADERQICGTASVTTLCAGQHIDAGTVTVSNDGAHLYVKYETTGDWYLKETHLEVSTDLLNTAPKTKGGPIPGKFQYSATHSPVVQVYEYSIALDTIGSIPLTQVCILAHAAIVRIVNGEIVQQETGWGGNCGGLQFPGKNWAIYFCYTIQECGGGGGGGEPCDVTLRTQTQGGWGTRANGNNPGTYRDNNFSGCFPNGVTIGCANGYTLQFTSSAAIEAFLPQGGTPAVLTYSDTNPIASDGGVLAGQVLALSLSVGFDACNVNFGADCHLLGDMVLGPGAGDFAGMTVGDFLDLANNVLGGCDTAYTPAQVNAVADAINNSFVDGTTTLTIDPEDETRLYECPEGVCEE